MLQKSANIVKGLAVDAVEKAQSGHPGMPVGCAEIGTLLYTEVMEHNPQDPDWPDRDRFVLSAGHGSMLLYSILHLSGYDLSLDDLKNFRQLNSPTAGHPEYGHAPGIETTTGPLGQGIANAVGMALAEEMLATKFNRPGYEIVDHYTYTIAGDGCMMEGVSSEAASLAGHLGLGKLIAFYDSNQISIEGSTELAFTEDVAERFKSYDWQVIDDVDGHSFDQVRDAIRKAKADQDRPTLIVAKTKIAHGSPTKEGKASSHGAPLGPDEVKGLKENIGLPVDQEFYISDEVKEFWQQQVAAKEEAYDNWVELYSEWRDEFPELAKKWDEAYEGNLPADFDKLIADFDFTGKEATRKASGKVLKKLFAEIDYLVGGSADLAPSTKTYFEEYGEVQEDSYDGQNLRFGVREHAMGSIANGLALHGGLRPFTATFLVFSDYMRPAIRLAALMGQPVIYVFTHDSIYLGEDGPTHQPVEHLESLRLIPNLTVLRPADGRETALAWQQALENKSGPTALVLTRQGLEQLDESNPEGYKKGGYPVEDSNDPDVILMASGSEVSLAVNVAHQLEQDMISSRVISVPDREKFTETLSEDSSLLEPETALRVVLEAGVGQGWFKFLGSQDLLYTVETFGKSAPGEEVGKDYGFSVDNIVADIKDNLEE
ncbi:transketolase [Halanaerobiaceae bacterium Z-7014]|uniref:Transketolase n=1 Tax=Halonatronomonas betaini TaxID=2778430 RepID=A0A931ASD1_9FIRM|nr:transketolase [Halonatronomonas betaini]MBF8435945.1 transketolase [Halonatronomonas betaini]